MKLYLARHGKTNYNDLQLCNADPAIDVHLTSVGIAQAKALADMLKQVHIQHIFVSELKRTLQTAEIINKFHDLKIQVDPRLNDIRSGFEGKHFKEYIAALDAAPNRWTARFSGGESIEDTKLRSAAFVENLRTKDYAAVLVVTSEWIIRAIIADVQQISNEEAWNLEVVQGGYLELDV